MPTTGRGFLSVSFISCHPLCLLGITGIFFISKHHAKMLTWLTNGEAVFSRAIIQPWQLLNSWACCQSTSAQGRLEAGLEGQTGVSLGWGKGRGWGSRSNRVLVLPMALASVIFSHRLRPICCFLASWVRGVCTNAVVCTQAEAWRMILYTGSREVP